MEDKITARKAGLITAAVTACVYAIIIGIVALNTNALVLYALLGAPAVFFLAYFLGYTVKSGMVKFLTPSQAYKAYENPVDGFFRSEYDKSMGSIVLTVLCFIPTLVFYFFFSWIFYLVKRNS